jgi:hypothetical protein
MPRSLANLLHRIMVTTVVVCVSMCCCQAKLLAPCGPDLDAQADGCLAGSCCNAGAEQDPADGDEDPSPSSCAACCIKGTGLKDVRVSLPVVVATVVPYPAPVALLTPDAPAPATWALDRTRLRQEPMTLLRLRCALVI